MSDVARLRLEAVQTRPVTMKLTTTRDKVLVVGMKSVNIASFTEHYVLLLSAWPFSQQVSPRLSQTRKSFSTLLPASLLASPPHSHFSNVILNRFYWAFYAVDCALFMLHWTVKVSRIRRLPAPLFGLVWTRVLPAQQAGWIRADIIHQPAVPTLSIHFKCFF